MKKNVWIFNHYAAPPSATQGLRHFNFAKYLIEDGYDVKVFASSCVHNSEKNFIISDEIFIEYSEQNVPFIFLKTRNYKGNGKARILNMLDYYKNIFKAAKSMKQKPDIIIASSFHLLACVAGIKLAKKYKIKCICEIRDLWPEVMLLFTNMTNNNIVIRVLRILEKWIYRNADKLIFTLPNAEEYLNDRNINIPTAKLYHINNGVDLDEFNDNILEYTYVDKDLSDANYFNLVYTGSIRLANRVGEFVDVAELIANAGLNIKILIWGNGDLVDEINEKIARKSLKNIVLKGRVDKKYIPSILSQSDATLYQVESSYLLKYGLSPNKLFDYFASGKPVISVVRAKKDLIESSGAGVISASVDPKDVLESINEIYSSSPEEYSAYCKNAYEVAKEYDFKKLTIKLEKIIAEACSD